jgi:hypothetical protein
MPRWGRVALVLLETTAMSPRTPPIPFEPLFRFGALALSAGVDSLTRSEQLDPLIYLRRHLSGDWGDLDEKDLQSNDVAMIYGNRLLSSYRITPDQTIWIITEADRSLTTVLFPDEY